jgi:hypothetical protein
MAMTTLAKPVLEGRVYGTANPAGDGLTGGAMPES